MASKLPAWIIVLLAVQLLLGLFLFALGWSMTSSLAQGRPPPFTDIMLLASPALTVILCAIVAVVASRGGNLAAARIVACAPIPIVIILFVVLGAI